MAETREGSGRGSGGYDTSAWWSRHERAASAPHRRRRIWQWSGIHRTIRQQSCELRLRCDGRGGGGKGRRDREMRTSEAASVWDTVGLWYGGCCFAGRSHQWRIAFVASSHGRCVFVKLLIQALVLVCSSTEFSLIVHRIYSADLWPCACSIFDHGSCLQRFD
jgi:hypothetical protein